ncbi:hypothetical protein QYE76_037537 [Lolium multiflorum]|uniref:Uncharacterized protein n=1 Tax=Lolium multiflorum TaxID=4521 RepID=A0AAD8QF05_LOLMU|nr:hypothetical protein QYE76_037537 [Lolium multiflorum]
MQWLCAPHLRLLVGPTVVRARSSVPMGEIWWRAARFVSRKWATCRCIIGTDGARETKLPGQPATQGKPYRSPISFIVLALLSPAAASSRSPTLPPLMRLSPAVASRLSSLAATSRAFAVCSSAPLPFLLVTGGKAGRSISREGFHGAAIIVILGTLLQVVVFLAIRLQGVMLCIWFVRSYSNSPCSPMLPLPSSCSRCSCTNAYCRIEGSPPQLTHGT